MNEIKELSYSNNNYLLSSWESEIISVNIPSFCFTCLSDSEYQLKCDYYMTTSKYVGSDEKNYTAGQLGSLYVSNRTKYVKFSVNNLSTPCTLNLQGFCYSDNSISLNQTSNNDILKSEISNLPFNAFGEFKTAIPNTYLHYKWTMSALNSGAALSSLVLGYSDIHFHSNNLLHSRGAVKERGTLDLLVPDRSGSLTFQRIVSREILYQASTPMSVRWTTIFDSGVYNVETGRDECYIGFGNFTDKTTTVNPRNFYGVGFSGSVDGLTGSEFGIFYFRAGVRVFIPQTEWNGDKMDGTGKSGYVLDVYKGNIWQSDLAYLGFSQVNMQVNIGGEFITVHTFDNPNNVIQTHVSDPSYGLLMQVTPTIPAGLSPAAGGALMGNASFGIILWSKYTVNDYHAYSRNITYTAPNESNVILIQNPFTFNSRINSVLCSPLLVSCACDGTKIALFNVYQATSSDVSGAVWSNIGTSTPVQYSTVGSVSNASLVFSFVVGKTESKTIDFSGFGIYANGETVWLITIKSTGNADIFSSISWTEIM